MAYTGTTLATFSAALTKLFEDKIITQVNRAVVGAQLLEVIEGRGQNVQWPARVGTQTGYVLADGADVTDYHSDTKVPAVLQYGTYVESLAVSDKAIAAARASTNPTEMLDLLAEETMEAVPRLARKIGADFYSGTGAADTILGLVHTAGGNPAGALQATGVYAGIDRAVYPQWASNVVHNGGVARPLTTLLMRDTEREIYVASGMNPDLILCDPYQHEQYGLLLGPSRRYLQEVTLRGQKITLDGGYKALDFDGTPVIRDAACPAGTMLFMCTEHCRLYQLKTPEATLPVAGTPEAQFGAGRTRLSTRIKALAPTGAHIKLMMDCWVQLQIRRPNCCGQLKDLATS